MTLFEILKNKNGLTADSRQVREGWVFVAVRGTKTNGHAFIERAIEQGATAIICEKLPENQPAHVVFLKTDDSAAMLGEAASIFYGEPSSKLQLVGVTGTNGKTTVATLLFQLFTRLGFRCGLLSTVENRIGERILAATHTTPDAVSLQKLLAEMVEAGCSHCFMEVSSHAVHQKRIAGLKFRGGLFTNLTHDHLDYHETFQAYRNAKKAFFDQLDRSAFALVNADDRNGLVMLQNTAASKNTFGLRKMADFKAKIVENSLTGLQLLLDGTQIHARLIGEFNASNLAAAYGAARLMGFEKEEILTVLSDLRGAEGRFERIVSPKNGVVGIVDYAHTPDALKKVLETINELRKNKGQKLITVVGCGGDRDKTKRPIMAALAARLSDTAILTSDNPRTENPDQILKDMGIGLETDVLRKKTLQITDRRQAIRTAVRLAEAGDVILVAGKGHEKYQEINGVRHEFDDLDELRAAFE